MVFNISQSAISIGITLRMHKNTLYSLLLLNVSSTAVPSTVLYTGLRNHWRTRCLSFTFSGSFFRSHNLKFNYAKISKIFDICKFFSYNLIYILKKGARRPPSHLLSQHYNKRKTNKIKCAPTISRQKFYNIYNLLTHLVGVNLD